jgi:hypothetical protein
MVKRKTALKLRKAHRYLGIFLGLQFIMWTVSGLYFSWTDINEIHGDNFKKHHVEHTTFTDLADPSAIIPGQAISSLELKDIAGNPFYLLNKRSFSKCKNRGKQRIK